MFITPMVPVRSAAELTAAENFSRTESPKRGMFADVFQQAIGAVKETEDEVARVEYQLATGQLDDIHSLTIAQSKAGAAINLLVQLRNRSLEAYNELMRVNL